MAVLEIENLSVDFATAHGAFRAVDRVSLTVDARGVLAIVGESGSGKSVSMLAVMGLLPWTANVTADRLAFEGRDLLAMTPRQRRNIIGKDIAMIFQEPMSSLNPCFTVGFQLTEALKIHLKMDRATQTLAGKPFSHNVLPLTTPSPNALSGRSTVTSLLHLASYQ